MSDWTLTKGLQHLRAQVNEAFPHRDKTSDGTIGDTAHQAETSGHNPDDTAGSRPEWDGDPDSTPEVRAWDMDSDLGDPAVTAQQLVDHLRSLPGLDTVIRYMIYNRRIYRASTGWAPEAYTGASAHTEHIHFSGARSQAADENTTFDYHLEELAMPTADEIAKAVWSYNVAPAEADRYSARGTVYDTALRVNKAVNSQIPALLADAGTDPVDDHALATTVAAAVLAALPAGTGVTAEQLQTAIVGALRELAAPAA
jgi:hypothetical protein